jgi:hypothetical protein
MAPCQSVTHSPRACLSVCTVHYGRQPREQLIGCGTGTPASCVSRSWQWPLRNRHTPSVCAAYRAAAAPAAAAQAVHMALPGSACRARWPQPRPSHATHPAQSPRARPVQPPAPPTPRTAPMTAATAATVAAAPKQAGCPHRPARQPAGHTALFCMPNSTARTLLAASRFRDTEARIVFLVVK